MENRKSSIGQMATIACTLEVTIPKPGNVHRGADFAGMTFADFLLGAVAIGPVFDRTADLRLGQLVLGAVQATRNVCAQNTNLGMILLLAPIAAVDSRGERNTKALLEFLNNTTAEDCQDVYQAIRLCQPGGLGESAEFDVIEGESPDHILDAMRLAESRDMIARQYVNGFEDVLQFVWPQINAGLQAGQSLPDAVIQAHLMTMHQYPDSLIARKNGTEMAMESAAMAGDVLSSGDVGSPAWLKAVGDLDFWLRADGNRRNPGTTADLIAAALFAGLCQDSIDLKRAFH